MNSIRLPLPLPSATLLLTATVLFSARPIAAEIIWRGDFETGTTEQWRGTATKNDRVKVVTDPVRAGKYAVRIDGTNAARRGGRDRIEFQHQPRPPGTAEGTERYFGWSVFLPQKLTADAHALGYFEVRNAWRQLMSFEVRGEDILYSTRVPYARHWDGKGKLSPCVWHDFALHVLWSRDPAKGFVEVWFDGAQVVPRVMTATLLDENEAFFQIGLMRPTSDVPETIIIDHVVEATTLEEVTPPPLPLVVQLWPGEAPEEPGTIGEERRFPSKPNKERSETTEVTQLITNVTKPTITLYRPTKEKDTGAAMLICPGGGYHNLWWQLEGEEVAAWLNSIGVTGVLLKYRVPRRPDDLAGEHPARRPLQDAQRAVRLVRSKAMEWGIDPRRIGIVGFSAGGHLAIATATSFEKRTYAPIDDIDKVSCRPDFSVPVYSGYLKSETKDELAAGLRVPVDTPPVFLAHGGSDPVSPPEPSGIMYLALRRAGVPTELHIYAGALHGFGVRPVSNPCGMWTRCCTDWMRHQGFLTANTP